MNARNLLVLLLIVAFTHPAFAISTDDYLDRYNETRKNTRNGTENFLAEAADAVALLIEWTAERARDRVSQVHINSPLGGGVNFAFYDPTTASPQTLTYGWIDRQTLLPVSNPIDVAAVRYELNDDPNLNTFTFLGISSESTSNFALSFVPFGFEPLIRATPLDAAGNPIFVIDADGSIISQGFAADLATPEPTTLLLLGTTLAGLGLGGWRRRRQAEQPTQ